jgi:hypothetical protein
MRFVYALEHFVIPIACALASAMAHEGGISETSCYQEPATPLVVSLWDASFLLRR